MAAAMLEKTMPVSTVLRASNSELINAELIDADIFSLVSSTSASCIGTAHVFLVKVCFYLPQMKSF